MATQTEKDDSLIGFIQQLLQVLKMNYEVFKTTNPNEFFKLDATSGSGFGGGTW